MQPVGQGVSVPGQPLQREREVRVRDRELAEQRPRQRPGGERLGAQADVLQSSHAPGPLPSRVIEIRELERARRG
jgi:hypothetical protein